MSVTVSGALTSYAEQAIGNQVLRNTAPTFPTTLYLALYPTDPGKTGTGTTEQSGNGYARQSAAFAAAASVGSGSDTGYSWSNSGLITFPADSTSDWGSIGGWALWDASSSGNPWAHGSFGTAKTVQVGDQFQVIIGALTVALY